MDVSNSSEAQERLAYESPVLTDYGSVRDLTQAGLVGSAEGGSPQRDKRH